MRQQREKGKEKNKQTNTEGGQNDKSNWTVFWQNPSSYMLISQRRKN